MYSTVFYVTIDHPNGFLSKPRVQVDSFISYEHDNDSYQAFINMLALQGYDEDEKNKLIKKQYPDLERIITSITGMGLRQRFNSHHMHGPYVLRSDMKLDREIVHSLIIQHQQQNDLDEFLRSASVDNTK